MTKTVDLDKLEQLAKAATTGPWTASDGCCVFADGSNGIADTFALNKDHPNGVTILCPWSQPQCNANARHIAAASPDVVLALVNEVRRLRELAEAVETFDENYLIVERQGCDNSDWRTNISSGCRDLSAALDRCKSEAP